jgi:hypothetical protein
VVAAPKRKAKKVPEPKPLKVVKISPGPFKGQLKEAAKKKAGAFVKKKVDAKSKKQ